MADKMSARRVSGRFVLAVILSLVLVLAGTVVAVALLRN